MTWNVDTLAARTSRAVEAAAAADGLKPSVEHWRTRPFAGGLV